MKMKQSTNNNIGNTTATSATTTSTTTTTAASATTTTATASATTTTTTTATSSTTSTSATSNAASSSSRSNNVIVVSDIDVVGEDTICSNKCNDGIEDVSVVGLHAANKKKATATSASSGTPSSLKSLPVLSGILQRPSLGRGKGATRSRSRLRQKFKEKTTPPATSTLESSTNDSPVVLVYKQGNKHHAVKVQPIKATNNGKDVLLLGPIPDSAVPASKQVRSSIVTEKDDVEAKEKSHQPADKDPVGDGNAIVVSEPILRPNNSRSTRSNKKEIALLESVHIDISMPSRKRVASSTISDTGSVGKKTKIMHDDTVVIAKKTQEDPVGDVAASSEEAFSSSDKEPSKSQPGTLPDTTETISTDVSIVAANDAAAVKQKKRFKRPVDKEGVGDGSDDIVSEPVTSTFYRKQVILIRPKIAGTSLTLKNLVKQAPASTMAGKKNVKKKRKKTCNDSDGTADKAQVDPVVDPAASSEDALTLTSSAKKRFKYQQIFAGIDDEPDDHTDITDTVEKEDLQLIKSVLALPEKFAITAHKKLDTDHRAFTATLRLPFGTKEEIFAWKKEVEEKSGAAFVCFRSKGVKGRVVSFKREYCCKFFGSGGNIYRTKKTGCETKMEVTIKNVVKYSRSRDKLLKLFPTRVIMNWCHNHPCSSDASSSKIGQTSQPGQKDETGQTTQQLPQDPVCDDGDDGCEEVEIPSFSLAGENVSTPNPKGVDSVVTVTLDNPGGAENQGKDVEYDKFIKPAPSIQCSRDAIAAADARLNEVFSGIFDKLHAHPEVMVLAVNKFHSLFKKVSTKTALVKALKSFGKPRIPTSRKKRKIKKGKGGRTVSITRKVKQFHRKTNSSVGDLTVTNSAPSAGHVVGTSFAVSQSNSQPFVVSHPSIAISPSSAKTYVVNHPNTQCHAANLPSTHSCAVNHQSQSTQSHTISHPNTQSGTINLPSTQSGTINHPSTQSGTINHPSTQSGTINHPSTQYGTINHPSTQSGTINHPSTQSRTINHPSTQSGAINHPSTQSCAVNHPSGQTQSLSVSYPSTARYTCGHPYTPLNNVGYRSTVPCTAGYRSSAPTAAGHPCTASRVGEYGYNNVTQQGSGEVIVSMLPEFFSPIEASTTESNVVYNSQTTM